MQTIMRECTRARCLSVRSSPFTTVSGIAITGQQQHMTAPDAWQLADTERLTTRAVTGIVFALFDLFVGKEMKEYRGWSLGISVL